MRKIIKAVFTLSFFSILDRLLGFIFKIYLSRKLGAELMGVYQVSLSIFFVLLTITTSGVPLVVSKLTAKYRLSGNIRAENGLATAALVIGLASSIFISLIILLFNAPISSLMASKTSMTLVLMLLPALIFSSVYSALRGNLWGRQKYLSVSLLEILEQVTRIALCILLFMLGFDKVNTTAISLSAACLISATACVIVYLIEKGRLSSPRGHIIPLIKSSAPITISRAASSVVSSIIAIAVPFLLITSGMTRSHAMYVYGFSVGMALPLLYIPLTIVGSLAFAMIPTLSASIESAKKTIVRSQIERAISFSIIIACVFLPFFSVLGKEIGVFIYKNADSGRFLSMSAWLLVPLAIECITSSMMNSLDLEMRSFFNYFIGSLVMFLILFASYKNFSIELLSISMGICWCVASFLDILSIRKKTGIGFGFIITLIKCAAICLPAALAAKWSYGAMIGVHTLVRLAISGTVSAAFVILLAMVLNMLNIPSFFSLAKENKKLKKQEVK